MQIDVRKLLEEQANEVEVNRVLEILSHLKQIPPEQYYDDVFYVLIKAAEFYKREWEKAEAKITKLARALKPAIRWMQEWLDEDLCECEYGHTCGKNERQAELEQMKQALSLLEEQE